MLAPDQKANLQTKLPILREESDWRQCITVRRDCEYRMARVSVTSLDSICWPGIQNTSQWKPLSIEVTTALTQARPHPAKPRGERRGQINRSSVSLLFMLSCRRSRWLFHGNRGAIVTRWKNRYPGLRLRLPHLEDPE